MWQYSKGTVVRRKGAQGRWGHVEGFKTNNYDETCLIVRWENGRETTIHPDNVDVLEGLGV